MTNQTTTSETLVKVEGVSKKFCRNLKKSLWYGMKDLGGELMGRGRKSDELRDGEFWAVKDVSFELKRGECLGLIGRNGAGKTTLLRMLNGLIKPDTGWIEMRGRVGALIALGAGFNPILTGRENIYVNAAVLGLSKKETDEKFDEIVDFAELGEFIDAPVQSYSSGMQVRLGFAVAAILIKPDILFLDEVLAVGDIGFTIKCLNVVRGLTQHAAVVFVSHNMQFISSFCTRVIVMEYGKTLIDSLGPAVGIDRYYSLIKNQQQVCGTGEAQVKKLDLIIDGYINETEEPSISQGVFLNAVLRININSYKTHTHVFLFIHDESMAPIVCIPIHAADSSMLAFTQGEYSIEIPIGIIDLNAGKYSFVVVVRNAETSVALVRMQGLRPFRVISERTQWGKIVRPAIPNVRQLTDKATTALQ